MTLILRFKEKASTQRIKNTKRNKQDELQQGFEPKDWTKTPVVPSFADSSSSENPCSQEQFQAAALFLLDFGKWISISWFRMAAAAFFISGKKLLDCFRSIFPAFVLDSWRNSRNTWSFCCWCEQTAFNSGAALPLWSWCKQSFSKRKVTKAVRNYAFLAFRTIFIMCSLQMLSSFHFCFRCHLT